MSLCGPVAGQGATHPFLAVSSVILGNAALSGNTGRMSSPYANAVRAEDTSEQYASSVVISALSGLCRTSSCATYGRASRSACLQLSESAMSRRRFPALLCLHPAAILDMRVIVTGASGQLRTPHRSGSPSRVDALILTDADAKAFSGEAWSPKRKRPATKVSKSSKSSDDEHARSLTRLWLRPYLRPP